MQIYQRGLNYNETPIDNKIRSKNSNNRGESKSIIPRKPCLRARNKNTRVKLIDTFSLFNVGYRGKL